MLSSHMMGVNTPSMHLNVSRDLDLWKANCSPLCLVGLNDEACVDQVWFPASSNTILNE